MFDLEPVKLLQYWSDGSVKRGTRNSSCYCNLNGVETMKLKKREGNSKESYNSLDENE